MGRGTDMHEKLNILVTGGAGFLGKAIVKRLVSRGYNVTSFSRGFYPELEKMGVRQVQGDLSDKKHVTEVCSGMDGVFHVAAKAGVWGSYEEYFDTNVKGTENIIEACFFHKIQRLVYTSSPSVVFNGSDVEGGDESLPYPDSFHAHYPKTKAIAEKLVIEASKKGLRSISLRPHLIWGPEDNHLVPRILARAKRLARVGNENKLVDTIYVDNAAHAHMLAFDRLDENHDLSGNVYFISQDEPIPLWDMVNAILAAGGKEPVTRVAPASVVKAAGIIFESVYGFFKIKKEPPMTKFVAEELATAHWFNISRAKNDLGYAPEISTTEGLKILKNWLDKNNVRN
ncbi:NAD-dependent epimerase/dehydratase family protein [Desulforegula conservatrix]|uniref:NAD-dependent epimerase/dehydratase family protein n=1 Tax=Desulforegula conservatrix TaxID=153026 RepID=UPI0018DBBF70|nr:NAD-dependent epimerase/dehydratase family protein [Desulforegula conservatrix]